MNVASGHIIVSEYIKINLCFPM